MAEYNNHQQGPFWDFVRASFDQQNGEGAFDQQHREEDDLPGSRLFGNSGGSAYHQGPPNFGAWGWGGPQGRGPWDFGMGRGRGGGMGRGGRHRHSHREQAPSGEEPEQNRSRTASPSGEQNEGEGVTSGNEGRRGRRRFGGRSGGRRHERHGHEAHGHGAYGGPRGPWDRRGPPPGMPTPPGVPGVPAPFDLSGLFDSLNTYPSVAGNPWVQMLRQFAQQAGVVNNATPEAQRSTDASAEAEDENTFTPAIDVFNTPSAWVLHIAIPGAKKEDVGVNWDADKGELNVAGVVYRQGDEVFLKSLSQNERKVGVFERSIQLPLAHETKEEVDGDSINAKLEEGILTVTVSKAEKEWTDVKRVDIQ